MSAQVLDGKAIAGEIRARIKAEVARLKSAGIVPHLATLLVGDNPASQIYLKNKHEACKEVGIESSNHQLPQSATTEEVWEKLSEFNLNPKIYAILVQLPLPSQIDTEMVLSSVAPQKDVDGFNPINLGRLISCKDVSEISHPKWPLPVPCTPQGILALLEKTGVSLAGKNALVIGRSVIVGKPVAALLLAQHATVTIAHSRTRNLLEYCKEADIVIAAIGKPKFITGAMLKENAIVIDVGINRDGQGRLCGDVDFESAKAKAAWITPVPGGVGPMTIAMLLKNTVQLAKYQNL